MQLTNLNTKCMHDSLQATCGCLVLMSMMPQLHEVREDIKRSKITWLHTIYSCLFLRGETHLSLCPWPDLQDHTPLSQRLVTLPKIATLSTDHLLGLVLLSFLLLCLLAPFCRKLQPTLLNQRRNQSPEGYNGRYAILQLDLYFETRWSIQFPKRPPFGNIDVVKSPKIEDVTAQLLWCLETPQ